VHLCSGRRTTSDASALQLRYPPQPHAARTPLDAAPLLSKGDESMQPDSSDLYKAHGAYLEARGRALGSSTFWLRLNARWLISKFDTLSHDQRAKLVAIRGVLAGRGVTL
jgi:hypothetical protein